MRKITAMRDIATLPGFEPHNIVAYDTDENGEIIESTATTLN